MEEDGTISDSFRQREEEYDIISVSYEDMNGSRVGAGILCTKSTDEKYIEQWGVERFNNNYSKYGIETIWGWGRDSGLKPCAVYLRHCILAAEAMGADCFRSFLDETVLVDRKTTVRKYLEENSSVMGSLPPEDLNERYGGP